MPAVDVHAHAMPLPHLQWLVGRGLADLSAVDPDATAGIVRLDPRVSGVGAGTPLPLARSQWDVATRLTEMDAADVTHHAVSLPPFLLCSTTADAALATEVVRRGNDALAEYVASAPDRLVALGSVPLGVPGVEAEAARCLDDGMAGIAIGTRGAGRELDDPVNEGLWELLHERGAFVLLHPSGVPDIARISDYYLPQLVGYPMETALAVSRLIFAGVRERHPFTLCLAHGGGCLPWLRGRLDLGWERKEVAHSTALPPSSYVRDLYFDSAVFSAEIMRHLVADFGADRVLLGTDFPFELADRDPLAGIAAIGCSAQDAHAICWENGAGLLGLTTKEAV
jgi:aminocarboxymuconate-semialdehyde decarboxylase